MTPYPDDFVPYGHLPPCPRRRRLILDAAVVDARTADLVARHPELLEETP
jgi:hypothetical protein